MTPYPAELNRTWLPVCLSAELKAKPLARQVAGRPIVVFRARRRFSRTGARIATTRCPTAR